MADLVEEDLEFRGGTLQLSSDNGLEEHNENSRNIATENSMLRERTQNNVNPSVLSGANSLSTSSSSFADAHPGPATTIHAEQSVYPRYDMPFSKETIKDFFTFRNGVVEHAIRECITALLFPEDGDLIGSWLLTEITLWDNEKERIVILTSKVVMTVKYDFIALKQLDFKKTYLHQLDTIVVGELIYPPSSLVPRLNGFASGVTTVVKDCVIDRWNKRDSARNTQNDEFKLFDPKFFEPRERNLRGVRLMWNKGQPLPMKTLWNPFSQDVPFLTFASHPIFWHKEASTMDERSTYDMECFAHELQRAIEAMPSSECCIHHAPIVIQSYVGVTSMLHNKTSMGFFKVRGKFSF